MTANAQTSLSVCIVGTGPAGSVLAVELARYGHVVQVLEVGTKIPDFSVEDGIDQVSVSGETDLKFGFSRQVGGATNLWAGRIAPLETVDFERGWPVTREEMQPFYDRASKIIGIDKVGSFSEDSQCRGAFAGLKDVVLKTFLWAKKPFHAGHYLEEALNLYPNLSLQTGKKVLSIHKNNDGNAVTSLDVLDVETGKVDRIEAAVFVLAAGGIETPRLLLNSGIGGVNVGKFFSTHPKADMAVLKLKKRVKTNDPLFVDSHFGDGTERFGLGLSRRCQLEKNVLNHYVQVFPLVEFKATRVFEKVKGASLFKSRFIDDSNLMKGFLPAIGLIVFEIIGKLAGLQRKTSIFMLRGFLDQFPVSTNCITLSEEPDAYGQRKANISWTFSEEDKQSVLKFFDILDQNFRDSGLGFIEYTEMRHMRDWPLIGIHSHFMGTTRMGDDPAQSVTNRDARVHGMENLFISGPSLFTSYGYANPVYTISALALRLADHISGKLG